MKKERIARLAKQELEESGFATVLASNMHTCADVIAARGSQKFIIKVAHNIDSVTKKEASSLFKLAKFLDAEPIILGSMAGIRPLRENVSSYRFDVRCVSPSTLRSLLHGEAKLFSSRSFGVKGPIDGMKLRSLRKVSGMRMSELAKQTGLSESTLYKHEEGQGYAAVSTILRIERVLNGRIGAEEVLQHKVQRKQRDETFGRTGLQALELRSAPFDIIAKERNYFEISFDANFRTMEKRAAFFAAIKETFDSNYPFFLAKNAKGRIRGIPVVDNAELSKVSSEDELLNIVY
ncbi:MAG: helix-turn-helix domain-containing protein [Candidatus Micrarchaeota archaeon]|nr:helix-turn-helix domain-containing protein [Candidatus Micrarchaeota archaeon]